MCVYDTSNALSAHMSSRLFAAGIAKCPQHVPLYQAWACLELRSGDIITAKRLIGEALTRDKRNGSGWLVAAKIEEKMNNNGLVGLILRRGIECAPGNIELYRALAEHEISRGKIDSVSFSPLNDLKYCAYHVSNALNLTLFSSLADSSNQGTGASRERHRHESPLRPSLSLPCRTGSTRVQHRRTCKAKQKNIRDLPVQCNGSPIFLNNEDGGMGQ